MMCDKGIKKIVHVFKDGCKVEDVDGIYDDRENGGLCNIRIYGNWKGIYTPTPMPLARIW